MTKFPFAFVQPYLQSIDFVRFSKSFAELVLAKIPTAGNVFFLDNSQALLSMVADKEKAAALLSIIDAQSVLDDLAVSYYDCLLFSLPVAGEKHILVLVDKIDPHVVRRFGDDWLTEIRSSLAAEFTLLKQARVDMETGLFNSCNLHYLLEGISESSHAGMVLVSLPPKGVKQLYAISHVRRAAALLENYLPASTPLHHLGQCVFAFVPVQSDDKFLSRISMSLIHYLKKERFSHVHIGYCRGELLVKGDRAGVFRTRVLDDAWNALEAATLRGPFSFCSYESLAYPDHYLLKRPDESLFTYFRKAWRNTERFSLVRFIPCSSSTLEQLQAFLDDNGYSITKSKEICLYLFLEQADGDKAVEAVEQILLQFSVLHKKSEPQFSAGIGVYPFCKFSRSDVIMNSRKACAHGEFFGAGSIVVFDALSLNVSGDIYYAEGDLKMAVCEYKNGLDCSPDNINLLNSLGVAYIFLNQFNKAKQCFKKVLELDTENFMALYNCGLVAEHQGKNDRALHYFEQAIKAYTSDEGEEILEELRFTLGRLHCEYQNYKSGLRYLKDSSEDLEKSSRVGQLYRLTGIALCGIGQYKKGEKMLQRALQVNQFDAEALSVLGEQYYLNGQGNDIALSFCSKSVELEPQNIGFLLRLTRVQLGCNKLDDASENLRLLIRNKKLYDQAAELMVQYYDIIGNSGRKLYWQRKCVKN